MRRLGIDALSDMQLGMKDAMLGGGKDVVLLSPTGTGKTPAYLLPLAGRLDAASAEGQAGGGGPRALAAGSRLRGLRASQNENLWAGPAGGGKPRAALSAVSRGFAVPGRCREGKKLKTLGEGPGL